MGWPDAPPGLFSVRLFKWRQFEPEVILLALGRYLRFSLSYRDVEELLAERGLRDYKVATHPDCFQQRGGRNT